MRIAVVQHVPRPAPAQDLEALVAAVVRAASSGVQWVVLPAVPALDEGPLREDLWRRLEADAPGVEVIVAGPEEERVYPASDGDESPGTVVVLVGDDCYSTDRLREVRSLAAGVVVLAPGSESELQVEAALEFAIDLSTSVASVVIIVETDGAQPGEPGHGGSAIMYLGEVAAQAMSGDETLSADIPAPAGPPEAPGPLPPVPPLLAQRVAAHHGQKLEVDYPADLD